MTHRKWRKTAWLSAMCFAALVSSMREAPLAAQVRKVKGNAFPKFKVEPSWPKIPNNWQFGQVSSVAIDKQDHVWILQRPSTLEPAEKPRAAPPLLEFDADGNFIQAWGGPGPGYEWPGSEHGVYVDA